MSTWVNASIVAVVVALAAAALSCGPKVKPGVISADGYRHATYPYGVIHELGDQLLPPVWLLDNYYLDRRVIKPKAAPEYMIGFHLDTNNDGVVDEIEQGYRYDLSFVNQRTSAQIYVRTVPQSYEVANLSLDVVARRFTDSLAGGDFVVVEFGTVRGLVNAQLVETKRYVTTMESGSPATMAGVEAYEATIAIRNAAQVQGQVDRPDERRRVVFCRPGFAFQPKRSSKVQYPVLLIASYQALPEKFEEGLPDFERFLDAIAFAGRIGYERPEPVVTGELPQPDAGATVPSVPEDPPLDLIPAPSGAPPPSSSSPSADPPANAPMPNDPG